MKLLFYNHTGQVSGAERMLLLILARLEQVSCSDAFLVCPAEGTLRTQAEKLGVRCEPIDELKARFTWRIDHLLRYLTSFYHVIHALRAQVVCAKPDLIHANSIRAGLVVTAATIGLRVPVIWHLHDVLPRHPLSTLIRWFALSSTRTHMIAVSGTVANKFKSRKFESRIFEWLTNQNRVTVIHNGVEVERFRFDPIGRQAVRDELAFGDADFVLGIVGQLTPRKGQLELLNSFAKTLTQNPHSTLLIIGAPMFDHDRSYQVRLTQAAKRLGISDRVRFLGARSDVAAVVQALDLVIINSRVDPFPLVALEAMASGTPVLATAVDGIPELIRHQETGWLVAPRDEAAMTQAIIELAHQPELRVKLGERGRQHVHSRLSAKHYMHQLNDYYRTVRCSQPGAQSKRFVERKSLS